MSRRPRAPRLLAGLAALLTAVYGCSLAVDTDGLTGGASAGTDAGGDASHALDATTDSGGGGGDGAILDAGTDAPPHMVSGDGITDSTCSPKGCAAQGIECGDASNLCGRQLDCGNCHQYGDVCTNGQCGCTPKLVVKNCVGRCGQVPDGCGGFEQCPGCNADMFCGPDNTCSTSPCAVTGDPQNACGTISDGCGGTREAANGTTCPMNNVNNGCNGGSVANRCGCYGSSCAQQGFTCSIPGSRAVGDLCEDPSLACGACTYPPGQCNALHECNTCTRVAAPAYPYDTQCPTGFAEAWACDCGDGGSCFVPDGFSASPQTCQLLQVTSEHAIYCCAAAP